jgi:Flp pilus assembly protein CpaB
MPFTPRTSSDTRNSAIVVAIVILTTALVVVLGLVFLALAKNSQAVPRGPGESGGQVLLAVRDAPVPGAYSLDQLSKECSGPGNLPSLTSS